VAFGLPAEYRHGVAEVIERSLQPVEVTLAAHGQAGSSILAFRRVATFLLGVLDLDVGQLL
jgi:hypothetical protein